ncbi:hypothetical protein Dda_8710 [Drechslerella dactyloides]|uniref:Uncharacterized protein n=1 Tax=Drechslerella dactyloides TaxID=74499 RepID=A0AAD6NEY7_DREDA|nr:hypothetical protein Dda_8710 [Drechslerella dactyloides]
MLLSRTAAVLRGLFSSGQLRRLARTGRRGLFASGQLTFSGEPTLVNLDRSPDSFLPTNYTSLDILILAVLYSTIRCCVNLKDGSGTFVVCRELDVAVSYREDAADESPLRVLQIGKIIHLSVDAVIVSAFLAGVKRSTGLSFKTEKIESKDFRGMVNRYLDFGEWVMDQSIAVMGTSAYFERKIFGVISADDIADDIAEAIGF